MARASLLLLGSLVLAASPAAASCVHPTGLSGCFTTVQAAVDAASPGERLAEVELAGEPLAAGSARILDISALRVLSASEREVALELVRGATVAEIAKRRASSPLTVESQIKAVYAKLGVRSRVELATRLGGAEEAATS